MGEQARVVAVVVTWNRCELLQESIAALRAQTLSLAAIVVVDNDSDDGTAELLASPFAADLDVLTLQVNTGGAGGFAAGIAHAMTYDPDLVWLLDDDTVPRPSAIAELVYAWRNHPGGPPAVVASKVVWTDGRDHPMNTPRLKPGASARTRRHAGQVEAVPIRSASFVSIACDATVIRERGLPIADYFLWNDDFEYSTRLIRGLPGLYVPASVVVHKTSTFGSTEADPGERFYYEVRNKVWLFRRSSSLAAAEKVLYLGSSARRWWRTYRRSSDRPVIARCLRQGIRDGLRQVPRSQAGFFADAAPGTSLLAEIAAVDEGRPFAIPAEELPPFSVLLPVYLGDQADQFRASLQSVTQDQELVPDEVVIVRDGPVSKDLADALVAAPSSSSVPIRVVEMAENCGLGAALAEGLRACTHDVVARQDADDMSTPNRFADQIPLIAAGFDLVGSAMAEFTESAAGVVEDGIERPVLVQPKAIAQAARLAQPVFHPTVVYRRSAVETAGGYQVMPNLEDYWLFARMIQQGSRITNVARPLVRYRISSGAYARRGGPELFCAELRLQRRFREIGFTTRAQYLRNIAVRGTYRLVPESVRKLAYRNILLAMRRG